jgi:hypothetical protein
MDAPQSTTLLMIFRLPIMRFLPGDRGRIGPIQSFVPIIELTAASKDCQQSRLLLYTFPRDLRFRPLGHLVVSERMNERSVNFGASEKAAVESAAGAEAIVDCVFRAILECRLPPAAKLSERVLCEVFRTSRSTVRRALLVLAERGTVALLPNREAFAAVPSSEEAHDDAAANRPLAPRETSLLRDDRRLESAHRKSRPIGGLRRPARQVKHD